MFPLPPFKPHYLRLVADGLSRRHYLLIGIFAGILCFSTFSPAQCVPNAEPVSQAPIAQNPVKAQPQFFDQPNFTVAGVTDASNPAGHGSTAWRTTDVLSKDTVTLSKEPPPGSAPVSTDILREAAPDPENFDANHLLGKLLLDDGKAREAIRYLEQASRLRPNDYKSSYELALAYAVSGDYAHSLATAQPLLAHQDTAELHHLLADDEEKLGNPLAAVREYQHAAEIDPSESNLFDWGAELLLHHAPEPATEVFVKGNHLYPQSARMLIGLAVAWYARGSTDRAGACLCQASDLNPRDPSPYLFLGKLLTAELTPSHEVVERFKRFAAVDPENAMANYYYAVALWKRGKTGEDAVTSVQVESLLQKSITLDPKLAAAYLQLGIMYSEQQQFSKAIAAYLKAVDADRTLAAAHYRLAQAYGRTGEKAKAEQELTIYEKLSKQQTDEAHRQRSELQQFVYTLRTQNTIAPTR